MNWLEFLVGAVRRDRLLQIGLVAFVILSLMLFQTLSWNSMEARKYAPGPDGRAPLIVALPIDRSTVREMVRATLTGRTVVVTRPDGSWRRLEPDMGPDGNVQDYSDTLEGLFKLSCTDDYISVREKIFAGDSEEERERLERSRQKFCEMAKPD